MKVGWQTSKLGDLLAVLRNGVNCRQDKSGKGDKISRIESISDARFDSEKVGYAQLTERDKDRYRLQRGDILFSHINSVVHVGKTAVFDSAGPVYHGVNLLLMRPTDVVTSAYLEHALKFLFQSGYWRGVCKQSVNQASVNQQDISRVEIAYPRSLAEQQRIVDLLHEAFAGVTTAKANAEKNLQNARALFESHLQSVFTQRGKGWVDAAIGEISTLKSGTTVPPTLERPIGDIPYLKVADMTVDGNEDEITTSSRFLSEADVKESAIIPKGATIFPKRGGAILTNKKRIASVPICADLNIMAVIPSSQIHSGLLYFYFLNVDMRQLGTGSSIPQINNYDIAPLLIAFPKVISEQRKLFQQLRALREQTQRLASLYERKLAALGALKKSLLHQAFSGEL